MKIMFSTFEFWPGVLTCLNNLKSLVNEEFPDIQTSTYFPNTNRMSFQIIKDLRQNPPDILFLGGWDDNIRNILHNKSSKTKVALMWCSPMTQIDLSDESVRFQEVWRLSKEGKINWLVLPLASDFYTLSTSNANLKYMPIYMDSADLEKYKVQNVESPSDSYNADIFCAPCPRKNILNQICGLIPHKEKIHLHLNYGPSQQNSQYINFTKEIYGNFTNHGWMDRSAYLKKIQEMSFGMQVSLSESFNYVAAEHMHYGVPMIISQMSPLAKYLKPLDLVVDNPQDSSSIENLVKKIINHEDRQSLKHSVKDVIDKYNLDSKEIVLESISEMIA